MNTNKHPLHMLYSLALEADAAPDAAFVAAAVAYAATVKDDTLAAKAARTANLSGTARTIIAANPAAEVRIAWLKRADITDDERNRALAGEKRITVLAVIAAETGADAAMLDHLAGTKGAKVLHAVALNPAATSATRVKAVLGWEKATTSPSADDRRAITRAVKDDPDSHDPLARTAQRRWLLEELCDSDSLSPQGAARLAEKCVTDVFAHHYNPDASARRYHRNGIEQSRDLSNALKLAGQLVTKAVLPAASASAMAGWVQTHKDRTGSAMLSQITPILASLQAAATGGHGDNLVAAAATTDDATLAAMAEHADASVAQLIAHNRAASAKTTVAAINKAGCHRLPRSWFAARRDQIDVVVAVAEYDHNLCGSLVVDFDERELWDALMNSNLFVSTKLDLVRRAVHRHPKTPAVLPDWLIASLPVASLDSLRYRYDADSALAGQIAAWYAARLADKAIPVEVVNTLAEGYQGNLGELLSLAGDVCDPN